MQLSAGSEEYISIGDLAKTIGWSGATLHANAYQIHGQGLLGHHCFLPS